jgi:putative acetyltransferase
VDAIRRAGHSSISLVALDGSSIVGHILFTPVSIESSGTPIPAFGLAPMAVLPQRQRQSIGSQLVVAGLRECAEAGCQVVVVVGHPEFYPRFGFRRGSSYGLRSEFDVRDEVFMVAELTSAALAGRAGLVRYLPEFSGA